MQIDRSDEFLINSLLNYIVFRKNINRLNSINEY